MRRVQAQRAQGIGTAPGVASLRFVNNIFDSAPVNIWINGELKLSNIRYPSATTYLTLSPGQHQIKAGTGFGTSIFNLDRPASYTAILHGTPSQPSWMLLRDIDFCPPANRAFVRFIHGAHGVPNIDLYSGDQLVVNKLAYGSTSKPTYRLLDPGFQKITISAPRLLTETEPESLTQVGTSLDVHQGEIYTIILSGQAGALSAIVTEDSPEVCTF